MLKNAIILLFAVKQLLKEVKLKRIEIVFSVVVSVLWLPTTILLQFSFQELISGKHFHFNEYGISDWIVQSYFWYWSLTSSLGIFGLCIHYSIKKFLQKKENEEEKFKTELSVRMEEQSKYLNSLLKKLKSV